MISSGNDATLKMWLCPHCRQPLIKVINPDTQKAERRCTNEECTAPNKPHVEIDLEELP